MPNIVDRMMVKLTKQGPEDCWPWHGAVGGKGGPVITEKKRTHSARRVMLEHVTGAPVPSNRLVSNACGNPLCLNPAHLILKPFGDDVARFWGKVQKTDGCWLWLGAKFRNGYGAFHVGPKVRHATHVAWELTHGPIEGHVPGDPEREVCVMHLCDNPPCVRPDHLKLGTDAENIADMLAKGRAAWQRDPVGFREKSRAARERRRSALTPSNGSKP